MRYLLALSLGALSGITFQTQLPLLTIFPILVAMFILTQKVHRKQWIALWVVFGVFQFAFGLQWLNVVGVDIVILVSLFCALSFFFAAVITSFVRSGVQRAFFFVVTLTLIENIRDSFPFGGFGWLQYGMILVDSPLSVLHRVLPQLLVTLFVLQASLMAAYGLLGAISRRQLLTFSLLAAAVIALSSMKQVATDERETFRVVAIQGGVERYGLGVLGNRTEVLQNHINVTKRHIGSVNQATVVLWPENSLDIDPKIDLKAQALLEDIDDAVIPPIILGSVLSPSPVTRSNTTLELNNGTRQVYTKQRLVPFGEFLPFRDFARNLTDRANLLPYDFLPGSKPGIWTSGNLQISIGICFEVADGFLLHREIEHSDLVLIQTNNATYQFSRQSEQQLIYAKIRSIETGRPVISISTSGVSALISEGEVLQTISKGKTGLINFEVANNSGKTIASSIAASAGWLVFVLWFIALTYIVRKHRR